MIILELFSIFSIQLYLYFWKTYVDQGLKNALKVRRKSHNVIKQTLTYAHSEDFDYPDIYVARIGLTLPVHYANTPMQYTAILHGCKNVHFQLKIFNIFLIFAQNIDCGYT